jgi:hypothetical protein
MVHVDVQVQNSWVHTQELQDTYYNIVDVAEPTGLGLFRMMISSRPVHHNITQPCHDGVRRINTTPHRQLTKVIQALKPRTVKRLVDLEQRLQLRVLPDFPSLLLLYQGDYLVLLAGDPGL